MHLNTNEKESADMIQTVPVYPEQPGVVKTGKGYQFTVCAEEGEDVELLL